MEIVNKLFTERFRPKTLDEIVLSDRVMKKVQNGLKQNILLVSQPGRGKSSLSYILCNISKMPYLYINASRETSVDIIRDNVVKWCSEPSLLDGNYNKMKAVILDEFDGFSEQALKALKGTIEQFADESRFIATCNYIEKIPAPLLSRFNVIDLDAEDIEEEKELRVKYYKKTNQILNAIGMKTSKDGIIRLSDLYFPDFRAIVNKIEDLYISGLKTFNAEDIKNYNLSFEDIYKIIIKPKSPVVTYKLINENYSKKLDEILISLGNDFIEYLRENNKEYIPKIPDILITVADHQYKSKFTIDKLVNVLSCIYLLQKHINS